MDEKQTMPVSQLQTEKSISENELEGYCQNCQNPDDATRTQPDSPVALLVAWPNSFTPMRLRLRPGARVREG
jgi:hypothetical protein